MSGLPEEQSALKVFREELAAYGGVLEGRERLPGPLPFRVLRPDAETDFLAFSLPDAPSPAVSNMYIERWNVSR